MVKVRCGVYGEGTVFSVEVASKAEVEELQKAIVNEKKDVNPRFNVDPATLTLYIAKEKEGDIDKWLKDDDNVKTFLLGKIDKKYKEMRPSWRLNKDELLGPNFQPGEEKIHVLVELKEELLSSAKRQKVEENTIDSMSDQLKSFKNAKLDDECISTTTLLTTLPYPHEQLGKLYVRKCYKDIFDLFLQKIKDRFDLQISGTPGIGKSLVDFGISGTPGIGKSLLFVYILYRLVHTESPFKPKRIVYHTATNFTVFDLQTYTVSVIDQMGVLANLVRDHDTFYIIDGKDPIPVPSSCVTMYIASPRSDNYKEFVKQKNAQQWFLPIWTLDELKACRERCYPDFRIDTLNEQYRIYGGVARSVFQSNGSEDIEACMADADAIKCVRNFGHPTRIFATAHMLLHVIVSDDGNYKFKHVDIASKYVGEQLWKKHAAQMVINLSEMFGGSPDEISRHLFEIYGHLVFSQGGRTLRCRNLDNGNTSQLRLNRIDGNRESFTRNSIPKKPITHYYEPSDDDTFPAIDSLSPQGMFQFTVGTEHPIRGVQILQEVCKAFDKPYSLYFVVPPHRFEKFTKQPFKARKGNDAVTPIDDLEQYVLELAIEES